MANPYIIDSGSATLLAGQFSVAVTHGYTMDDTTYEIDIERPFFCEAKPSSITTTGFTINVNKNSAYNQTLKWGIRGRGAKT